MDLSTGSGVCIFLSWDELRLERSYVDGLMVDRRLPSRMRGRRGAGSVSLRKSCRELTDSVVRRLVSRRSVEVCEPSTSRVRKKVDGVVVRRSDGVAVWSWLDNLRGRGSVESVTACPGRILRHGEHTKGHCEVEEENESAL